MVCCLFNENEWIEIRLRPKSQKNSEDLGQSLNIIVNLIRYKDMREAEWFTYIIAGYDALMFFNPLRIAVKLPMESGILVKDDVSPFTFFFHSILVSVFTISSFTAKCSVTASWMWNMIWITFVSAYFRKYKLICFIIHRNVI